ncbi:hypothetical protein DSECCO2_643130 [anaerobic digester metagenome]
MGGIVGEQCQALGFEVANDALDDESFARDVHGVDFAAAHADVVAVDADVGVASDGGLHAGGIHFDDEQVGTFEAVEQGNGFQRFTQPTSRVRIRLAHGVDRGFRRCAGITAQGFAHGCAEGEAVAA